MLAQSRRALEHLHPNNLAARTSTLWTLGFASFLQGDRAAARRAYSEAIALSQTAAVAFSLTGPLYWNLFYVFFSTIEIACTVFIVWYAWTWPHPEGAVLTSAQSSGGGES